MEWGGGLARIQTAIHLGGYMDDIYLARDIWAVLTRLTVRCWQPEPFFSLQATSLGREPSPMELFVETHVRSQDRNSSWATVLNTSWYVRSIILFRNLLFSWIEYDDFFKKNQETYNSRLRERYGDDHSTHPDFDSDLWIEVGSSSGPDKNQVYGLSNTTAKNLRTTRSVSTVGSSPSVSST
jgi:hypothetical protein